MKKPTRVISLTKRGQPRARADFAVVDPSYQPKRGRPTRATLTQWDRVKSRVLDLDELTEEQVVYRDTLIKKLEEADWNVARCAKAIGRSRKFLYKRIIILSIPLKRRARGQEIFDFAFKGFAHKEGAA